MYLRYLDPTDKATRNFAIRKPIVSLGRAPGNDIVLPDALVAPTHANLLRKPRHLTIAVVDRGNELYVNGRLVRRADLRPGDRFLVGRFEMVVHDGEPDDDEPAAPASPEHQVEALARLVEFSRSLAAKTRPDRVFGALLKSVVELTNAEKGFVIVLKDGERHLAASHNVGSDSLDLSRVSDSIVESVVRTRRPLIVSDAMADDRFGKARSVVDLRLSSVMCVPLIHRDDLLGVIYLGNDSVRGLFERSQLAVLEVFASQAALIVSLALALDELKTTNRNLRDRLRHARQGDLIGSSAPMKAVFRVMRKVAATDITVLIQGETGTGKELVARELHKLSNRSSGPFISVNCGAIPENLLESELFGHRKGAFTGATADKIGKFGAADGGTLFLDEVGEMPPNLQVKLLRVLQDRVVERVGECEGRPVDLRVIGATNCDLEEAVRQGRFREDLYYRLAELTIQLPPLRERGDDLPQLANYFLNDFASQYNDRVRGFTNEGMKAIRGYCWPGNVRQLSSRIKKAVILGDRALLGPADLGLTPGDKRHIKPLSEAEEDFKVRYIREALDMNDWNKAQTARDLGVDPRTIFRYIEKMED